MNRYAWILTSFCLAQSKGMNRNKRNRYKSLILAIVKHEQLILVQGVDSKKGQLIYLTRKGSFSSNFVQNDQISIREIKETHETGQNSIFVNRLVFPMNFNQFNRFSHPMTLFLDTFSEERVSKDELPNCRKETS